MLAVLQPWEDGSVGFLWPPLGACGPDPYAPPWALVDPPGPWLAPLTSCWSPLGPCGPLRP